MASASSPRACRAADAPRRIDEQKGYLQALSDLRSWHRWQIAHGLADVRTMRAHESAVAYLDLLIATKRQYAAEDEAERRDRSGEVGNKGSV